MLLLLLLLLLLLVLLLLLLVLLLLLLFLLLVVLSCKLLLVGFVVGMKIALRSSQMVELERHCDVPFAMVWEIPEAKLAKLFLDC